MGGPGGGAVWGEFGEMFSKAVDEWLGSRGWLYARTKLLLVGLTFGDECVVKRLSGFQRFATVCTNLVFVVVIQTSNQIKLPRRFHTRPGPLVSAVRLSIGVTSASVGTRGCGRGGRR